MTSSLDDLRVYGARFPPGGLCSVDIVAELTIMGNASNLRRNVGVPPGFHLNQVHLTHTNIHAYTRRYQSGGLSAASIAVEMALGRRKAGVLCNTQHLHDKPPGVRAAGTIDLRFDA